MADAVVGLADSIEALRAELTAAVAAGQGQPMQFRLDPVELTLEVAVTKDGNGKIGWKVIEFGGSLESVHTQTLQLKLQPVWTDPGGQPRADFLVGDQGAAGQRFGPQAGGVSEPGDGPAG